MLGPLLVLGCGTLSIIGLAAPIVSYARHTRRGMGRALLGVPGAVLVWGVVSAFIGVAEKVWTWRDAQPWLLGLLSAVGLVLVIVGMRAALRPRLPAGHCTACGYACAGLGRCPECGKQMSNG